MFTQQSYSTFSITKILIILNLFLVPILYFKTYISIIPVSIEVILIPLLTLAFVWDYSKKNITLNNFKIRPFIVLFLIYLIVNIVSLYQASSISTGILEILRYLSYVFIFILVSKISFTKRDYFHFLISFSLSLLIVGLYGILQFIFDINLNKLGLYALHGVKGRVQSTFVNPNYYAGFINFVLPGIFIAFLYQKRFLTQNIIFVLYSILVINLILTYTRAGWLIMGGAFFLTAIVLFKSYFKKIFKMNVVVSLIILGIIVLNLPDVQNRTQSALFLFVSFVPGIEEVINKDNGDSEENEKEKEEEQDEANSEKALVSRTVLWKTGLKMFSEHPVLGVGSGNYLVEYKDYVTRYPELYMGHDAYSVHNSYIKIMAETGLLGLISFLSILLYYFYILVREFYRQNGVNKLIIVGLAVGSVTYMLQNLTNNLFFIPQTNIIFWLVSAIVFGAVLSKNDICEDIK